ncbi:hypothetical protein BB559_002472 [Furculomyces boomerangus]|uniref:Uncharacterized protein n=2 Tax=Harpellales TaxID=61421 RepID=A0A2T9YUZ6_9FUNG|nr:hypothetical protein BB559_002472 [Furculomyces boomerangus]PWA00226.1 hypothetical protein BB558_003720 [Smittium angustum]
MVYTFREDGFAVIEFDSYETLAIIGTSEINHQPNIKVKSVAGILNHSTEQSNDKITEEAQTVPTKEIESLPGQCDQNLKINQNEATKIDESNKNSNITDNPEGADQVISKDQNSDRVDSDKKMVELNSENLDSMDVDKEYSENIPNSPKNSSTEVEKKDSVNNQDSGKDTGNEIPKSQLENSENMKAPEECSGDEIVFGKDLEKCEKSLIQELVPIFEKDLVKDWDIFTQFCKFIFKKELQIPISKNQSPTLICVPYTWTKYEKELLAKMFFEELNVPAIVILERPLAGLFGVGSTTGVVIEISLNYTSVVPIIDSQIQINCAHQVEMGGRDIANALADLIKTKNPELYNSITEKGNIDEFCLLAVESGACGFELFNFEDEEHNEDAKSEDNKAVVEYNGTKFTLGRERFKCTSDFYNPKFTENKSSGRLADALSTAIIGCEPDKRVPLWESIHVFGKFSNLENIIPRMEFEFNTFVLNQSDHFSEFQTRESKLVRIPDYLYGWRNSNHMASFLGSMIIAKIALNDPKYHITKVDYNEMGPASVHAKQFA